VKSLPNCQLYTFVDTAWLQSRKPEEVAQQLCDGGADLIQLRAKSSTFDEVRRFAGAILPITNRAGVGLIINDYPQIALQTGAFGCHLGQEDFFDAGHTLAMQVTGCPPAIKLGLSTHAPEQARRALDARPDYIAIGPVFTTSTKPTARPVTLEYVQWAAANVSAPWFAIGGITLQNLDDVVAAGARRICVVSAILDAPDIVKACRAFKDRLPSAL
jgi:thiamine-phosphate pyrophosphorylase